MDRPVVGTAAASVRFTADLTCLLCGRSLGTLDGGTSWPPRGEPLLYRPGIEQPAPIAGWWRLRCNACGGRLMASEITSHKVRPDAMVEWTKTGGARTINGDLQELLGPAGLGISIVIGLGLHRNFEKGRAEFRRWTRLNPGPVSLRNAVSAWVDRVKP